MAVTVIRNGNDADFEKVMDILYDYFAPDDWDYIIFGDDYDEVVSLADMLHVCSFSSARVLAPKSECNDKWMAVTYHS